MSAGRPAPAEQPGEEFVARAQERRAALPRGPLDPATLHRARSINADALRVVDQLLDQIAEEGRR